MLKHISALQAVFVIGMALATYQANAQSFTVTNLQSDRYSQIYWDFTGWSGYDGSFFLFTGFGVDSGCGSTVTRINGTEYPMGFRSPSVTY